MMPQVPSFVVCRFVSPDGIVVEVNVAVAAAFAFDFLGTCVYWTTSGGKRAFRPVGTRARCRHIRRRSDAAGTKADEPDDANVQQSARARP